MLEILSKKKKNSKSVEWSILVAHTATTSQTGAIKRLKL